MTAVRSSVQVQEFSTRKSVTIWEVIVAGFAIIFGIIIVSLIFIKIYSVCKRLTNRTRLKHQCVPETNSNSCSLALIRLTATPNFNGKEQVRTFQIDTNPATDLALEIKENIECKTRMENNESKRLPSVKGQIEEHFIKSGKETNKNKTSVREELHGISGSLSRTSSSKREMISDISKELKMKHQFENEKLRLGRGQGVL